MATIKTKTVIKARHIGLVTDIGLSFHANWVRLARLDAENIIVLFEAEQDEANEADILIQIKGNTAYILYREPQDVGLRVAPFDVLDVAEELKGEEKHEA